MMHLHEIDHLACDLFGVGLLDQLSKGAFERGQMHEAGKLGGCGVGDDLALGKNDDAVTDALDDLEDVRDIKDSFALLGEQDEEVFEEAGGDGVESGKGFIEDDERGVVEQAAAMRTLCFMPLE